VAIRYKVSRSKLGGEEKPYPRIVRGKTVTGKQFQKKVAQRAARGLADTVAVMTAQRQVFLEELLDEQSVHIPGIGFFTLSVKGELDENERLVTETAKLRVNFRSERELLDDVNQGKRFEIVNE
jgi:hypothetical protein